MVQILSAIFVAILVKIIQDSHYIVLNYMYSDPLLYIASSLQPFGFACSSLFLAFKADSIGHKKVIFTSLLMLFFSLWAIIYINKVLALALTRFFAGLALGGINCSAYPYIKAVVSYKYLPFAMSCTYFSLFSGAAFAPMASKYIIKLYSWKIWIYCLLAYAAIGLLIFFLLKEIPITENINLKDIKVFFNDFRFIKCCLLGIFTVGHTYALQAINARFVENPVIVQIIGRAVMILATILMMFVSSVERLFIIERIGINCIGILGIFGAIIFYFNLNINLWIIFFTASYLAIGFTQTAVKADILICCNKYPSFGQGMLSFYGALWDWFAATLISIHIYFGILIMIFPLLFAIYLAKYNHTEV